MRHLTGSVVLVPESSFPSLSTHQHSPVDPWHCTSSYCPSSLHRGVKAPWRYCKGASLCLRWQEVTVPPKTDKTWQMSYIKIFNFRKEKCHAIGLSPTCKCADRSSHWRTNLCSGHFNSLLVNTVTVWAIALHRVKWTVSSAPWKMFISMGVFHPA